MKKLMFAAVSMFSLLAWADPSPRVLYDDVVNEHYPLAGMPAVRANGTIADNNGHGNNLDGVDVSNPGQGSGGPTGAVDSSGTVDDEAGGGGAAPSQGSGGSGKGGGKK